MITRETLDFLSGLKANNNREWFSGHKHEYQRAYGDALDTVVHLLIRIGAFDSDIAASALDPKSCLMRINRDVRFSKDKSPYKTNFFLFINKGGRKSPYAGYYLHIEPGASFIGGGIYMPEAPVLEKLRREISDNFREWTKIVHDKAMAANFPDGVQPSGKLKRAPKGYELSDPALEYLKFKGYYTQRFLDDAEVTSPALFGQLTGMFGSVKPLIDFINQALGNLAMRS
ncbi:MAG: DUF2461 domain-containing protein [Chlorobiaceae bacterium]